MRDSFAAALREIADAAANGRIKTARELLQRLSHQAGAADTLGAGDERDALSEWRFRLAAAWWTPLRGGCVTLRRLRATDADVYRAWYADAAFARRFNRQPPWTGDLANALARAGALPPLDLGLVTWMVCDREGRSLGLASLSSLDLAHARAEFALGFAAEPVGVHAVSATLLVYDFAFFRVGLNKLYTFVYADNERARLASRRIGLVEEGRLEQHFFLPPGEFVDVFAFGLTRSRLCADRRLVELARRRLGLDWRA